MRRPRRKSPHVAAPKERKTALSSPVAVGSDTATLSTRDPRAHASQQPSSSQPPSQTLPPGVRYEPDLAAGYIANATRHDEIYADFKQLISGR
jgi:hypothetical protein